MYRHLEHRLAQRVRGVSAAQYPGIALPGVVIEQPPKVELGDFAIPLFPLPSHCARLRGRSPKHSRRDRPDRRHREMQVAPPDISTSGSIAPRWRLHWPPTRSRRRDSSGQDSGRALQHQSQQSRAHRTPAQRDSRRHVRPPAAFRGQGSRCSELHRQHRRAGCRCGGRLPAHREEIARGNRAAHPPAALRLLLLGSLRPRLAVVCRGQAESAGAPADAACHRRRQEAKPPRSPI